MLMTARGGDVWMQSHESPIAPRRQAVRATELPLCARVGVTDANNRCSQRGEADPARDTSTTSRRTSRSMHDSHLMQRTCRAPLQE
jgi:hypothetical protein